MPDLPELEALVRATRPVPDPGWAGRLDGRAARGFPRATPSWYAVLRTHHLPALAVASVLAVLVVGAIAWPGGGRNSAAGGSSSAPMAGRAGADSAKDAASAAPTSRVPSPVAAVPGAGTGS